LEFVINTADFLPAGSPLASHQRRSLQRRTSMYNSNFGSPMSTRFGSELPELPTVANRRRRDEADEADDGKPRNKRPLKEAPRGKSKVVEVPMLMYSNHEEEYGSVLRYEEDLGNFIIQCEQCSVWQHGVCMGVANVDETPEHYYCEQCKPENHTILLRDVEKGKYGAPASSLGATHAAFPAHPASPLGNPPKSPKRRNKMNTAILLSIQDPEPDENSKRKRKRTRGVEDDDIPTPKRVTMSPGDQPTVQVIGHTMPLVTVVKHLVNQGCVDVSSQLKNIDEHSRYSGSLSDVYQARWPDGSLVAVKCLRALSNSDVPHGKLLKHTARELYTWSRADHPNILKLHGLAMVRGKLAMIAPWMKHCSLLAYIRAWPRVDRCRLCAQVAEGLSYMHGLGLVHGDVKGVGPHLIYPDHYIPSANLTTRTMLWYRRTGLPS
ncbi:unnamed protein product, partial [Rhizoctonia solani]